MRSAGKLNLTQNRQNGAWALDHIVAIGYEPNAARGDKRALTRPKFTACDVPLTSYASSFARTWIES